MLISLGMAYFPEVLKYAYFVSLILHVPLTLFAD